MQKGFSFVFDIGNVLFTHHVARDYAGVENVSFTPLEEGLALLKECHALSERDGSLVLACTNLKKHEIAVLRELFPQTVALFKGIVSPEEALSKKPDPAIFQYMFATYDLIPHQTLFFDDMLRNIEAARSVGMKGIHVSDNAQVRRAVKLHIPEFGS